MKFKIQKGLLFLLITTINFLMFYTYIYAQEDQEYKVGDVMGHIYSTDIKADIDGMPIQSYNIGGKTVIIVEDLRAYGFDVNWDSEQRTLTVETREMPANIPVYEFSKQNPGKVIGDIYYTDIYTYINSVPIQSYNIGGKTVVSIEELGEDVGEFAREKNYNRQLGYSNYALQSVWNEEKRTISLNCLRPNSIIKTEFGDAKVEGFYYSYRKAVSYSEATNDLDKVNVYKYILNNEFPRHMSIDILNKNDATYIEITSLIDNNLLLTVNNENLELEVIGNIVKLSKFTTSSSYKNCAIPLLNFNIILNSEIVDKTISTAFILDNELFLNLELLEKYKIAHEI